MALTTLAVAWLVYYGIFSVHFFLVQSQCPAQFEFYNSCYSQLCDTPWDEGEESDTVTPVLEQFCFNGLHDCPNLGTCAQFFSFDNNYSCCAFKNYATCFESYRSNQVCVRYSSMPAIFTTPVSRYWSVSDTASRFTVSTRTLVYATPHSFEISVGGPLTAHVAGLSTIATGSLVPSPTSNGPLETGSESGSHSDPSMDRPAETGAANIVGNRLQAYVLGILVTAFGMN